MKLYTNEAIDNLISKYVNDFGGDLIVIEDGSLATCGLAVLLADKKKTIVIKEVYLNEWSSGLNIRKYNKLPNKYYNLINNQ